MPEDTPQLPSCSHCGGTKVIRHGYSRHGKQRCRCRVCGRCFTQEPNSQSYNEADKERILRAYHERTSLRGLTRIFGVSRTTVADWLKKSKAAPTSARNAAASPASAPSRSAGTG